MATYCTLDTHSVLTINEKTELKTSQTDFHAPILLIERSIEWFVKLITVEFNVELYKLN